MSIPQTPGEPWPATAQWQLWGTTAQIVVTDPDRLPATRALVERLCADVELACSRFRPDAELHHLTRAGGRPVRVSPLLADLIAAALDAAERTAGDVDPTVGKALADLGNDRDLATIPIEVGPLRLSVRSRTSYRQVTLRDGWASVPAGVELDLGATARAFSADRCAALVAAELGTGVLVSLGGDLATAGPGPDGGWRIPVQDGPGEPGCTIGLAAGHALATSSTLSRRWVRDSRVHHIVDPATGMPVEPVLRTVSVAAPNCLRASTLSTSALVRGRDAAAMLHATGRPSRLVTADGTVLRLNGWPRESLGPGQPRSRRAA